MLEYMIDLNASAAARRAGYAPKAAFRSGVQNMQKPAIIEAIAIAKQHISDSLSWDAKYVREKMRYVLDQCVDDNNHAVASGLLNTMSKCEGMQSDNLKIDGRSNISFHIKTGKK